MISICLKKPKQKLPIIPYTIMKYSPTHKAKIILVPYPAQGHVTPMLKLAAALATHDFAPVVVTPEFIHRQIPTANHDSTITYMSIPDGLNETAPRDFFSIEMAMEHTMPDHLRGIVRKLCDGSGVVACMIVDLLASWAISVGDECGVKVSGFWPAMLATYRLIAAIPEMVSLSIISETGIPQHHGPLRLSPNQPPLSTEDLPWLIGNSAAISSRFKFWERVLHRSRTLPWLIVNTFRDELFYDNQTQKECPRIFPIAPLCKNVDLKSTSLWKEDLSCLDWLATQSDDSVVYISFGSWVSPIGEGKVKSLAMALEASGRPFIWVLGPRWRKGLQNDQYLERVAKYGKVVSWAPQMEVLQHKSVGCYLTHCGWNSTLEAIQCKKRLLCYPVAGDQFVNCAYIEKVWQIGIRINGFRKIDVEDGLRKAMEDDDMSRRLSQLNERIFGTQGNSSVTDNLRDVMDYLKEVMTKSHLEDF